MKRRTGYVALAAGVCTAALGFFVVARFFYLPPVAPLEATVADLCRRELAERPGSCTSAEKSATLLFAGDTAEVDAALPTVASLGIDYPFTASADRLRAADLAVVNLEAPITEAGVRFPWWSKYIYRAPAASAGALARAGFDVAGLANNHMMDYGVSGLADTLRHLEAAGVVGLGAGSNEAAARRGAVIKIGALRVGLLAYAERQFIWDAYLDIFAHGPRAGVAALDKQTLASDIALLHRQADLVIVSVHWGENYRAPTSGQLAWAEAILDAGADLVVGHHPHVPQGVVVRQGRAAVLSLGNYAFGTPGHPSLDAGMLLEVEVQRGRIERLRFWPLDVQNRRVMFRPLPLLGRAAKPALDRLAQDSLALGTHLLVQEDHAKLELGAAQ